MSGAAVKRFAPSAAHAWRRFKRWMEFIAYGVFDWLALLAQKPQAKGQRVALVHIELLGDAFLWLPYAQAAVQDVQRRGLTPVLICDAAVQEVFASALTGCEVIAINRKAFLRQARVRWATLRRLRQLGVAQTWHASVPRDGITQDAVVRALGAPAVGFATEHSDRPGLDRGLSRRLYQRLIEPIAGAHVQAQQEAFLQALGVPPPAAEPLRFSGLANSPSAQPYWILAPGASRPFRRWPVERFVAVAQEMAARHPDWRCVVVGTAAEGNLAQPVLAALGDRALDLTGKTTVMELLRWIAHARVVIGNDSAAGHIAAALGTPAVAVTGGGHWGRCFPYDPQHHAVRRLPVAVGRAMPCFGCDWQCVHTARTDRPYPCIDRIEVDDVLAAVEAALSPSPPAALLLREAPALEQGA